MSGNETAAVQARVAAALEEARKAAEQAAAAYGDGNYSGGWCGRAPAGGGERVCGAGRALQGCVRGM